MKERQKVVLEYILYHKKNIHQKKWSRTHKNKDGSYTTWGVTRQGSRFKKVAIKPKDEKQIKKSFKKMQKLKTAKTIVSVKLMVYEGRYIGKSGKITGDIRYRKFFKIGKRRTFKVGTKLFLRESTPANVIRAIDLISDTYNLEFF